jgi:hypothetical protein
VHARSNRPARPIPTQTKIDYWLDAALVLAYSLDYAFRLTGLTIHEWIGVGLAVPLLVHLTFHWDWVLRTTRRLFSAPAGREHLRWIVDLVLMLSMVFCVASGILISQRALPAMGLKMANDSFWRGLHTTTADVTVFVVALHLALNWRWILTVSKRIFRRSATRATAEANS